MQKKILVTGATGFVGSHLCREFDNRGLQIVSAARTSTSSSGFEHGALSAETNWAPALNACDVVVHLAARVHQMKEVQENAAQAYQAMNVDVTLNLARQAAASGVRRFVFISSVKVNGECSRQRPFTAADVPAPEDIYGRTKWEAECLLNELGRASGMDIVIVRPPLVYGPGVRANFLQLMRLVRSGIPMPFSMIESRRSLIGLDNLVSFLVVCALHPAAAGRTWMVSDQHDVTIGELVSLIAKAMGKSVRLFPLPPRLLTVVALLLGKGEEAKRLLDALQVDASPATDVLNWTPPVSLEQGIQRTVDHFLAQHPA